MSIGAEGFLTKHEIDKQEVLYIVKEDKKTLIVMRNGRRVTSIIPAKEFLTVMSDKLVSINKGILLSRENIVSIENGVYLMTDGSKHKGRVRTPGQHKRNRDLFIHGSSNEGALATLQKSFAVLREMPLPCVLIEIIFDNHGNAVDFIVRFCNDEMIRLSGKSYSTMINHSLHEICDNELAKHLSVYASVAKDGIKQVFTLMNPVTDKPISIYCFRPEKDFCACIMV